MTRHPKDGPFCWLSKAALRRIADACEGRTDHAQVVATYVALCWIASDRQAEEFTVPVAKVAAHAGISHRKASDALGLLVRLKLIATTENFVPGTKERGPNTYRLLPAPCPPHAPGAGGHAPSAEGHAQVQKRIRAETIEESLEESSEESPEHAAAPASAVGQRSSSDGATKREEHSRRQRPRDPRLDALATLDGSEVAQVTRSAWGAAAKALKDIREVFPNVDTDEIRRRAECYRRKHPTWALKPNALAKNWASLAATTPAEPALKQV